MRKIAQYRQYGVGFSRAHALGGAFVDVLARLLVVERIRPKAGQQFCAALTKRFCELLPMCYCSQCTTA